MNPFLRNTTLWAIEPDKGLPWLNRGGFGMMMPPGGEMDPERYIYESFVHELGDHLKPAAVALAKKIMDGSAGNVPAWGYKMLVRFPEETLPLLTPGLESKELVIRERAVVALGNMGTAATPAKAKVAKALSAAGEKEQLLLKWCLGEIDPASGG